MHNTASPRKNSDGERRWDENDDPLASFIDVDKPMSSPSPSGSTASKWSEGRSREGDRLPWMTSRRAVHVAVTRAPRGT